MNRKTKRFNVAMQIGTESPVLHHLHKYLLYLYCYLILQMVRDSPKLFILFYKYSIICPPSSVFSPQGAQATDITNPLGHVQTKEIDTATGLETTEIDPNGIITRKYYDGFGRLSGETFPGSSNLDKRYVYAIEDNTGNTAVKVITNDPVHGNISKTEIFDAKGRPKKIETLLPGNVKMVELTEYDSLGRVNRKSAPFVEGLGPIPWTTTEYNPEGEITKLTQPDGTTIQNTYSGLTTTSRMYGPSGSLLQTTSLTTDAEENPISRTSNGLTLTYEYDGAGRNTRITDPEGVATVLEYDLAGRRTKQVDKTSGETIFQYNAKGNLTKQTDARGMYISFEYDELDRITKLTPSDGTPPTEYHYDQATTQSAQALGKLTKITGEFGAIELGYDTKGAENYRVHTIDDIKAYLKTETDSHGRLTSRTLPDGTKLRYDYAPSGHMVRVGMDTSDGNSINHTVAQYAGPIVEGDRFYLERRTGNNVSTKIEFDPLRRRPVAMKTTLSEGQTAQHLRYSYDEKGNILEIKDFLREDKNQTFEYDTHNRITKAIGKYGTEEYEYTAGGNLKKRGLFTLSYDDPNHKHAVTRATSPNTGVFHYTYDATGNMVSRNGDTLIYDANRKLKEMIKSDGIKYRYKYDQNGLRVKKTSLETGEIVYSLFDGMYEIARRPSKPEAHTVYIRGIKDDLLAQITREDASLLISDKSESLNADRLALSSSIFNSISICKDKSVDCGQYLKNASKFYLNKYVVDGLYHSKYKNLRMIVGWGIVLGLLYWVLRTEDRRLRTDGINLIYRYSSPILITSVLFTFTSGCGIFTTGSGQGDAPWLLLAGGINSDTPSVRDDGMVVSGGGGGIPFTVPVTGMYFVHSDHLGSVSFLTNGRGAIVAGGEFGGKSDIQYKPYGEIDRPHSSGPDISKYKYTGQEEDKESGLLYYKARYYDPGLGRFLQADDLYFPDYSFGMNRMMYVEGNPVSFTDPTGNFISSSQISKFGKSISNMNGLSKGISRATFISSSRVSSFKKGFSNAIYGITGLLMLPFSPLVGIGYGLIKNPQAFRHRPLEAIGHYALLGIEFSVGMFLNPMMGKPQPKLKSYGGATVMENSPWANLRDEGVAAFAWGPIVRLRTGAGPMTELHEMIHVNQWYGGRLTQRGFLGVNLNEWEAELFSGTNSYETWTRLYLLGALNQEAVEKIAVLNIYNNFNLGGSRLFSSVLFFVLIQRMGNR